MMTLTFERKVNYYAKYIHVGYTSSTVKQTGHLYSGCFILSMTQI